MVRNFIFFSVIFLNVLFLYFLKHNEIKDEIKVVIEPGMRLYDISEILERREIIQNKFLFILWTKINMSDKSLKYGEYKFHGTYSVNAVLKKLKEGKSLNRKITIVEGSTKSDLLDFLKTLDPNSNLKLNEIPENIIANTYFYEFYENPRMILDRIILKSNEISESVWESRNEEIPLNNISEMFVLASIVEKETSKKKEKPIISGVFYNRIEKDMKLQSDPTVVYAITGGKSKMKRKLLRKDLKIKSDFNTYLNKGLPPEPICFPGIESLKSTVKPVKSNYLYFVANFSDGGHTFASTYKEHLQNIKNVKKLRKNNE